VPPTVPFDEHDELLGLHRFRLVSVTEEVTVSVAVPFTAPIAAVIVEVPVTPAVARPVPLIVATVGLLEVQPVELPPLAALNPAKFACAPGATLFQLVCTVADDCVEETIWYDIAAPTCPLEVTCKLFGSIEYPEPAVTVDCGPHIPV
jgi:hypothetical protein